MASVDLLRLPEVLEVLMITPDFKLFFSPKNIVSPFLQASDDHKELFVIDLIVLFCRREGLREKSQGFLGAILQL